MRLSERAHTSPGYRSFKAGDVTKGPDMDNRFNNFLFESKEPSTRGASTGCLGNGDGDGDGNGVSDSTRRTVSVSVHRREESRGMPDWSP